MEYVQRYRRKTVTACVWRTRWYRWYSFLSILDPSTVTQSGCAVGRHALLAHSGLVATHVARHVGPTAQRTSCLLRVHTSVYSTTPSKETFETSYGDAKIYCVADWDIPQNRHVAYIYNHCLTKAHICHVTVEDAKRKRPSHPSTRQQQPAPWAALQLWQRHEHGAHDAPQTHVHF